MLNTEKQLSDKQATTEIWRKRKKLADGYKIHKLQRDTNNNDFRQKRRPKKGEKYTSKLIFRNLF